MPKFHVTCVRTTVQRVTLEVMASTLREAEFMVMESNHPASDFEEVRAFDEGVSEIDVQNVRLAD